MDRPTKKIDILRGLMAREDWAGALSLASKFPRLGEHKKAIKDAHEAHHHPRMYQQLGKDVDAMFADGVDALIDRYGYAKSSTLQG